MTVTLTERYHSLTNEIARLQPSARLLAVSKGRSSEAMRALAALGQRDFGESYWQELSGKLASLADLPLVWHFIGRLQSNKCHHIAQRCDWVHSLCELRHAQALSAARPSDQVPLFVCVQVNVTGEASKEGLTHEQLLPFIQAVKQLPGLQLRGLMTMLPKGCDEAYQREAFQRCASWASELATASGEDLSYLSMGMSQDYQQALRCGTHWCRLGGALFP